MEHLSVALQKGFAYKDVGARAIKQETVWPDLNPINQLKF